MSARLAPGARLDIADRDTLFADPYLRTTAPANYDVFPDAREFVMVKSGTGPQAGGRPIVVLVNWNPDRRPVAAGRR